VRLQLKVCSARGLRHEKTVNTFVQCGKEKTPTNKCQAGQVSVYWNTTFQLNVAQNEPLCLHIRHKEFFLGSTADIGFVELNLPKESDQIHDLWVPILHPETKLPGFGELHCVLGYKRRKRSNVNPGKNTTSSSLKKPIAQVVSTLKATAKIINLPSGTASGGQNVQLLDASQSSLSAQSTASGRNSMGDDKTSKDEASVSTGNRDSHKVSHFEGAAAAAAVNEVLSDLEQVKTTLEVHGRSSGPKSPETLAELRVAKEQVHQIEAQIEATPLLSKEWRKNLQTIVEEYDAELMKLLSVSAWTSVRESVALKEKAVHKATKKAFALNSLDLFDDLIDKGFALQVMKHGTGESKVYQGDTVVLEYTASIWDAVNMQAISYATSEESGALRFVVGSDDVPKGLDLALRSCSNGCEFTLCLTPDMAYGETGTDVVPPNTHVLYEATLVSVIAEPSCANTQDRFADEDDFLRFRERNKRRSIRFPARDKALSLADSDPEPSRVISLVPPPLPPRRPKKSKSTLSSLSPDEALATSEPPASKHPEDSRQTSAESIASDTKSSTQPPTRELPVDPSNSSNEETPASPVSSGAGKEEEGVPFLSALQQELASSLKARRDATPMPSLTPTSSSTSTFTPVSTPTLPPTPAQTTLAEASGCQDGLDATITSPLSSKSDPDLQITQGEAWKTTATTSSFSSANSTDQDKEALAKNIQSVEDLLKNAGLLSFLKPLQDIGVESLSDMTFIRQSDLTDMKMKVVHIRKLTSLLDLLGISNSLA